MSTAVLFADITVVTINEVGAVQVTPDAWVAVRDGRITAVATNRQAAEHALADTPYTVYPGRDRLLLSTFANCHNHMAMTLLRNAADDLTLHRWLFEAIFPREERLNSRLVAAGSRLAMVEMIRSGTGACADMYYFHEATAQAALAAGFRLHFCVDAKRPDATGQAIPDERILVEQIGHWRTDDLLRVSLLIHSVYLYQPELYPVLADMAAALACPVQVHVAETRREVAECLERYGRKPAAQLARFGFFRTPTLAAHCVHLDDAERTVLADYGVYAVHCPASNLKLGSGIADVAALQQAGVPVVLGTDGPASNNNLDLYRDLRLASFLSKGTREDAALLPAEHVLKMVTTDGMAALGFADCGRVAVGCQADLQIVRTDSIGMTPLGNPAAALVYSAAAADVESVMVAGRWLMYKRELQTLDEEKIRHEAGKAAAQLVG